MRSAIRLVAEDLSEHRPQRDAVFVFELPELEQHEAALDRRDDGLEDRRLEEPGLLPLRNDDLTERSLRPHLARDGEDDEVRPLAVVGVAADDDGGAALAGGLVGEGKRDEDDVTECLLIGPKENAA